MNRKEEVLERFRKGGVLFDGGLGSMLIARGLPTGKPPEEWNRANSALVRSIHQAYLEAGADVIDTNTFGGTPGKLASHGLGDMMVELNSAGVRLALEAVSKITYSHASSEYAPESRKLVSLSIGPTGKLLPPVGDATEEEIASEYNAQLGCIEEDVDLILIETIYDLREGLLALEAAKSLSSAPVAVTLTLDKKPRGFFTLMGDEANSAVGKLEEAGADIVGANCTLSSGDMVQLAGILRETTRLPLLCQPNAGEPRIENGIPVYDQAPVEFAEDMITMLKMGINAVGGCCGTTPEFIREAHKKMQAL